MFTGIVQTIGTITALKKETLCWRLQVHCPTAFLSTIELGASISVDGVCLTIVAFDTNSLSFDIMPETQKRTTLADCQHGDKLNLERAARMGDEIGGHILSGHIDTTAHVIQTAHHTNHHSMLFRCEKHWMKYLFHKGYIAISGISLTIVEVNQQQQYFSVHLIPYTCQHSTLAQKKAHQRVNIEIDHLTKVCVDTVMRIQSAHE